MPLPHRRAVTVVLATVTAGLPLATWIWTVTHPQEVAEEFAYSATMQAWLRVASYPYGRLYDGVLVDLPEESTSLSTTVGRRDGGHTVGEFDPLDVAPAGSEVTYAVDSLGAIAAGGNTSLGVMLITQHRFFEEKWSVSRVSYAAYIDLGSTGAVTCYLASDPAPGATKPLSVPVLDTATFGLHIVPTNAVTPAGLAQQGWIGSTKIDFGTRSVTVNERTVANGSPLIAGGAGRMLFCNLMEPTLGSTWLPRADVESTYTDTRIHSGADTNPWQSFTSQPGGHFTNPARGATGAGGDTFRTHPAGDPGIPTPGPGRVRQPAGNGWLADPYGGTNTGTSANAPANVWTKRFTKLAMRQRATGRGLQ